jgi:hypothetical protein
MAKVIKNYEKLNKYLEDKNFDEKEALLSHYMQLKDTKFAENYKTRLLKEGIDVSKISDAEIKSAAKNVPLLYPAFAAVSTKNTVPYIEFISKHTLIYHIFIHIVYV